MLCRPWISFFLYGRYGMMCIGKRLNIYLGVLWVPLLLRGRHGTIYILRGRYGIIRIAKESDVRPGIPWALPFLLLYGRCGTICTAKGVGYTPGRPVGSTSFAWQVWDNIYCQGETDGRITVADGNVMWFLLVNTQTQHLHIRDIRLTICLREHPPLFKARRTTRLFLCTLWFSCCK